VLGTSTPSAQIEAVARRFNLPVLVNPKRHNIATDWNFVLNAAGPSLVTIAHQDDEYDRDYLASMLPLAERHSDLVIAFSDYREKANALDRDATLNLRVKRLLVRRSFRGREVIRSVKDKRRLLSLGNPVCCPSVLINRTRATTFQFSESYKTNLDWDAWLRLAELPGSFVYNSRSLVSKRIHAASETTVTIADQTRQLEDAEMFSRMWPTPLAKLISILYAAGYRANRVQ
jgi:hypothetical protein